MFFASPLFLVGLIAVAIPVIVHLFNFRRYKKVYFSNVDRLEELQSETRRQSNLRQLIIMALRIMAIVFLVLAFARPVIGGSDDSLNAGSSAVSIYIDNSFSMENTDGNEMLLDKAKRKAREIVAAYGPTDRFHLLTNDVESKHMHWTSRDDVLTLIDELQTSSSSLTLSSVARKQFDFLHGGNGHNKHAYVVSDFQSSMVDLNLFPSDSDVTVYFVPLESAEQNNVFIDSVSLNAPVYYRGSAATVEVWVYNDGDENLEKVPVALYINDRQRALAAVDLPARGTTSVELHFTVDEGGILDGRIETSDYPVTFDDKYFFSINVRDKARLLIVEGGDRNGYLERLFDGDSSVDCHFASVQQIDFSRFEENDVVILDELTSFTSGLAQTMHAFADNGGTLVVVPSAKIDVDSYNDFMQLFAAPRFTDYNKSSVICGTVDMDNALYRNVFAGKVDKMELPTVNGYYPLTSGGGTLREPIMTLANGDLMLCRVPCGSGSLYLFTTPLRDAGTDFVRQALFVPTLYNMVIYSTSITPLSVALDRAAPIPLASRQAALQGDIRLSDMLGDFEEIPDLRHIGGVNYLMPHGTVRKAGNYRLMADGVAVEGVSFNYSRQESTMHFLDRDKVQKAVENMHLDNCKVVRNADKPLDSYLKQQMEGRSLWRWCIVLALAMLLAEILLIRLWRQ